jgi:hypothetical protein
MLELRNIFFYIILNQECLLLYPYTPNLQNTQASTQAHLVVHHCCCCACDQVPHLMVAGQLQLRVKGLAAQGALRIVAPDVTEAIQAAVVT